MEELTRKCEENTNTVIMQIFLNRKCDVFVVQANRSLETKQSQKKYLLSEYIVIDSQF